MIDNKNKIIALTGSTGFIGKIVLKKLIEKGYFVRVITRRSIENISPRMSSVFCNLTDRNAVKNIFSGCNLVIHLAAMVPALGKPENKKEMYLANVLASKNVVDEAIQSGLEKIIFISSAHVYGPSTNPLKENTKRIIVSEYTRTKIETEDYVKEQAQKGKIKALILRLSNIYGENPSQEGAIFKFIKNVSEGKPIQINNEGNQSRDYLYVDDAADAICKAVEYDTDFDIFNIGSGKPIKIIEIAKKIVKIYKKFGILKSSILNVPSNQKEITKYLDCSKAKNKLHFNPKNLWERNLEKMILSWEYINNKSCKVIIFDLDGTLLDVRDRYCLVYQKVAENLSLPKPLRRKILSLKKRGLTGIKILRSIYPNQSLSFLENFNKLRAELTNSKELIALDKPYKYVIDLLQILVKKNIKIAIVTLRAKKYNKQLVKFGFLPFIDMIINISPKKFDKKGAYRKIVKSFGISTFSTLVIGDSPKDISDAKAIGMKTAAAVYGLVGQEKNKQENPDFIINDIQKVKEIVNLLF